MYFSATVIQAIFKMPEKCRTASVTRLHGVVDFEHVEQGTNPLLSQGHKINCQVLKRRSQTQNNNISVVFSEETLVSPELMLFTKL